MHINSLPPEVFRRILLHLKDEPILPLEEDEVAYLEDEEAEAGHYFPHLSSARLVCRHWDQFARDLLFSTVTLTHLGGMFSTWNKMLDTDFVRAAARCAVVHSATDDLWDRDFEDWQCWEQDDGEGHGDWEEFTDSIARLSELKAITSLIIRFSDACCGPGRDVWSPEKVELCTARRHLLQAIFETIRDRAAQADVSPIRSLTIENLQNLSLPDFTSSDLFKHILSGLSELHIKVTEEGDEGGYDNYLICHEHWHFEPVLRQEWLMPVSAHLKSLSLYFDEAWGIIPDYFCGLERQVIFPQLEELRLGGFVIGHPDQLDWVYKSPLLRLLHLDDCHIASYIELTDDAELSGKSVVDTKDWKKMPPESVQPSTGNTIVYHFSLTWQIIFDCIRNELPLLVDFKFHFDHHQYLQSYFRRPMLIRTDLGQLFARYGTASNGTIPTYSPAEYDMGHMALRDASGTPLNRHKETLESDTASLKTLLEECRRRLRI